MNPLEIALGVANALPTIVAGVEYLHNEKDGATKQQLALDSLTVLAAGIAKAAPNAEPFAAELNGIFSTLIQNAVLTYNALGIFKHKSSTGPAANASVALLPAAGDVSAAAAA